MKSLNQISLDELLPRTDLIQNTCSLEHGIQIHHANVTRATLDHSHIC